MLTEQTMTQKQPNRLKLISFAPAIPAPVTIIVMAACDRSRTKDKVKANNEKEDIFGSLYGTFVALHSGSPFRGNIYQVATRWSFGKNKELSCDDQRSCAAA